MTETKLLEWHFTPWTVNGHGRWRQQPIIVIEGRVPFFADHPDAYIAKLREMHDDPFLARGPFFALIGQLQDAKEYSWGQEIGGQIDETGGSQES